MSLPNSSYRSCPLKTSWDTWIPFRIRVRIANVVIFLLWFVPCLCGNIIFYFFIPMSIFVGFFWDSHLKNWLLMMGGTWSEEKRRIMKMRLKRRKKSEKKLIMEITWSVYPAGCCPTPPHPLSDSSLCDGYVSGLWFDLFKFSLGIFPFSC